MENQTVCPDCKASLASATGPTHAYLGGNAACWKVYGELLAKEYSDPFYMKVHRLTVDTYAAQHPGQNSPRAAQSVTIHLLALYLIFEKQMPFDFVTQMLGKAVEKKKRDFRWLPPPSSLGALTVADVAIAKTAEEHQEKVYDWANSVWAAWQVHHNEIQRLALELL
jgi:hypothetical protein